MASQHIPRCHKASSYGIEEASGAFNFVIIKKIQIQSWTFAYMQLIDKSFENEVTLRGQNISLKCYQPLELMLYFGEGFRSIHTGNIGSVGQRASKLLAGKVGILKKKSLQF